MSNQPAGWQVMNNEVKTSAFDTCPPTGWFKIHYSVLKNRCMGLNLLRYVQKALQFSYFYH
jgi:hypothetical protein